MNIVFRFLKKYRLVAFFAVGFMFIELMIELLQPFMISKIIDNGILQSDMNEVVKWGVILLVCTVFSFGVGILSSFFSAHVSQGFGFDMREKLYDKVQSLTFSVFSRFSEATLITRLTNDIVQIQNTVFMGMRIMLRAPLFVIGSTIMAFAVNAKLAIWFIAALPLLFIFLLWILKRGEKMFRAVQMQLDRVNNMLQQNLISMRLIRAFVRKDYEISRFSQTAGNLKDKTSQALRLTELTMPVILIVMNMAVLAIFWFGGLSVDNKTATVGEVVAIINYAVRTTGSLSIMSMIIVNFSRAKASAERVDEVFAAEEEQEGANILRGGNEVHDEQRFSGHTVYRNVSFSYSNEDDYVLKDISFELHAGKRIAVLGATGSGKSSLLQLLPRMHEVTEGEILIDGMPIERLSLKQLRSCIGYVPQEVMLFSGTIAENIRWGKSNATIEEVIEAAQMAQIHETIMSLPEQYETIVGQKGVNFSGGQKQRLSIARALVRKPTILLLDDCTSALDVKTEALLLDALKSIHCTTFLVTQKISSAAGADQILLLDDGQLLAEGRHEELLAQSELYRRICQSQERKAGVTYA